MRILLDRAIFYFLLSLFIILFGCANNDNSQNTSDDISALLNNMVLIQSGEIDKQYEMTSLDEFSSHSRSVNAFFILSHEVTWRMYIPCIKAGICDGELVDINEVELNKPVVNVSFYEITNNYIPWLNRRYKQNFRLPTANEFTYVAQGSNMGLANIKPEMICKYANIMNGSLIYNRDSHRKKERYCDDGFAQAAPIKSFFSNVHKVFDMIGNVSEWSSTCGYRKEKKHTVSERHHLRILKRTDCAFGYVLGGDYYSRFDYLHTISKQNWRRTERERYIGFRLAKSLAN